MDNFEKRISEAVAETLSSGIVENIVKEKLEKGIEDVFDSLMGYCGEGKKLIENKLKEVMIPAIEEHNFNKYLVKIDTLLTEIINQTSIADNKKILNNFEALMKEPEKDIVTLSEVFKVYVEHVAENIETGGLKAMCEDGEPYYQQVTAVAEVVYENSPFSRFNDCTITLRCEEDEELTRVIRLYKTDDVSVWSIFNATREIELKSLRTVSDFDIFMMTLGRAFADIEIDNDYLEDDVEPKEKPDWELM